MLILHAGTDTSSNTPFAISPFLHHLHIPLKSTKLAPKPELRQIAILLASKRTVARIQEIKEAQGTTITTKLNRQNNFKCWRARDEKWIVNRFSKCLRT